MAVSDVSCLMAEHRFHLALAHRRKQRIGKKNVSHRWNKPHHGGVDHQPVTFPQENITKSQADSAGETIQSISNRPLVQRFRPPDAPKHIRCHQEYDTCDETE